MATDTNSSGIISRDMVTQEELQFLSWVREHAPPGNVFSTLRSVLDGVFSNAPSSSVGWKTFIGYLTQLPTLLKGKQNQAAVCYGITQNDPHANRMGLLDVTPIPADVYKDISQYTTSST